MARRLAFAPMTKSAMIRRGAPSLVARAAQLADRGIDLSARFPSASAPAADERR
ncbi:MAG: hypothetical protein ACYCX6_13955 [Vulcanimicrobiaceae bacterium]